MKYELPEDLKKHYFGCDEVKDLVSYRSCKRRCPDKYRQCWEEHLRADLALDCAVENERNARGFVKCSKCGKICDVGLAFNKFLCSKCDSVEFCDADEQKSLMGDAFEEIDERELSEALKAIK